jgi:hypothetical protein
LVFPLLYPTPSDARFNLQYTVRRKKLLNIRIKQYSFEMCTAKLYAHSTDTALSIDTRTNTKYWKIQQVTYSGYQEQQHHLLVPDRFLKRISDPICTAILLITFFSQCLKARYSFNARGHILHPHKMKGMFGLLMDETFHCKRYCTCSESQNKGIFS